MNPQRLVKPAILWNRRSLVPFATPFPKANGHPLQVSARILMPNTYNALNFPKFQRFTKSSGQLDLKALSQAFNGSGNSVFVDQAGSYLFMNIESELPCQASSRTAVVFPDGALITWFMTRDEEVELGQRVVSLYHCLAGGKSREASAVNQFDALESLESIHVANETIDSATSFTEGDYIALTDDASCRSDDMLAVSMALAVAARVNVLEHSLDHHIESEHSSLLKLLNTMNNWKLSSISEAVFNSEKMVHNWRYYLNNVSHSSLPDCLWEYESLDKLYHSVSNSFDVNKRFNELQSSLTHYHEFLLTVGEYVRHRYSSRLERIIILIIAIEAALAFRHAVVDLSV